MARNPAVSAAVFPGRINKSPLTPKEEARKLDDLSGDLYRLRLEFLEKLQETVESAVGTCIRPDTPGFDQELLRADTWRIIQHGIDGVDRSLETVMLGINVLSRALRLEGKQAHEGKVHQMKVH